MDIEKFDKLVTEKWGSIYGKPSDKRPEWYLDSLQRKSEFIDCWKCIDGFYKGGKFPNSFFEVGAFRGLWSIAFSSFCELNELKVPCDYTTVTLINHRPENASLFDVKAVLDNKNFTMNVIDGNTLDDDIVDRVKGVRENFDLVFIDANHTYKFVKNDIEKFYDFAKDVIMFHDIRPKKPTCTIAVYQVLEELNIKLDVEISESNSEGIGIKYI